MKKGTVPIEDGFAARALLGAGGGADGADGAERIVSGGENAGHCVGEGLVVVPFEIGVDLEVLGSGGLDEKVNPNGHDDHGEQQLQEPIQIPRHSNHNKHLRRRQLRPYSDSRVFPSIAQYITSSN